MPRSARTQTDTREEKARFHIRPAYILLVLLLGLFAWQFLRKAQEVQTLQRQEAALRAANQLTQNDNIRTQRAIRWYRTQQFVEEEARAVLGYTMPGEVAVMSRPQHRSIPQVRPAPPHATAPTAPTWEQWWQAFFG